jgi:hemerythrin-like domain-containing protein
MRLGIRKLEREHQNIRAILTLVDTELRGIEQDRTRSQNRLRGGLDYLRYYFDQVHHPHEDLIFDYLIARMEQSNGVVELLLNKHQNIYSLGSELDGWLDAASIPRGKLERADFFATCKHYIQLEKDHLAKEEEIAFPLARQWLLPADWEAISARHRAREDPLFGEKVSRRYTGLYQYLTNAGHFQ